AELELIEHVPPIQLAIRLLIPAGSKLLEVPEVRELVGEFDPAALVYPWKHPDPRVDRLYDEVCALVKEAEANGQSRRAIFAQVWERAERAANGRLRPLLEAALGRPRATIPYLSEPWYC
ncbi:MAG: CUAEP/CCAEP-tail radical SAM (seleno)protein, partial [Candidatus Methylomirabilales bacterium]